ncbi:MAG TPA: ribonuclease H [Gemmatimonadaceae bacterium]|jgi:ribonuclease HI|nr:ribonuclease H [Gemmatimonadaceae bacterium]
MSGSASRSSERPLVAIYADESCLGNGREGSNPGAAAGVIEYEHGSSRRLSRWDYWISEPATTNNRMALRSVIEALVGISRKGSKFRVTFTSDSQYLVKGMNEWVYGWMSRGWKKKDGPLLNAELWMEAVESTRGHQVSWNWVRGHEGHPQNEYANFLATRAARDQTSSNGIVPSSFDEWLAAQRAAGKVTVAPEAFPTSEGFRPARPYPTMTRPAPISE